MTPALLEQIKKRKFDCVILDEAHRIKNRNAKVTKNIWTLHNIPRRLLLTGTPGHDTPEDMFMLLRFLKPATYTSYWKWVDEWLHTKTIYTAHGEVKRPDGIKANMKAKFAKELNSIAIQRKRAEVMGWSAEPDVIDIPLPVNSYQRKYLDELENYFQVEEIMCQGVLDRLVRYRQICNAPSILGLQGKSPKVEWLKDFIKENPDKSILVFSSSKKTLDVCNSVRCTSATISGSVPPNTRQRIVTQFQNGQIQVLFLQTQACKEGLTLDHADVEVFLDVYPPASDYLQAKDRMVVTRQEEVKPQTIYRLYMKDTYDEVCYQMVDNHTKQCDCINNFRRYLNEQKQKTSKALQHQD